MTLNTLYFDCYLLLRGEGIKKRLSNSRHSGMREVKRGRSFKLRHFPNERLVKARKVMALSVLDDKSKEPKDGDLTEVLGRTKRLWDALVDHITREYEPVMQEWSFGGEKYGWSTKLKRKKRTILYWIPCRRYFLCAFVLGGKATEAARQSDLPPDVMKTINEAPVYGEGRGFRLEVRKKKDVEVMKRLAAIKMAN